MPEIRHRVPLMDNPHDHSASRAERSWLALGRMTSFDGITSSSRRVHFASGSGQVSMAFHPDTVSSNGWNLRRCRRKAGPPGDDVHMAAHGRYAAHDA